MGEVRPSESLAEGEANSSLNGHDAEPQSAEVNGHFADLQLHDVLALFFEQHPCSAEAQERLRSCSPEVCLQVLSEFQPHTLGKSDYSRLLTSFIGKVECSQKRSRGPRREPPQQREPTSERLGGDALRKHRPMDEEDFEALPTLPDEDLEAFLATVQPYSCEEESSRLLCSQTAKLPQEREADGGPRHKASEAAASEDGWQQLQLPVGAPTQDFEHSLHSCQVAGLWENALAFLEQMQRSGISPEIKNVNAVLGSCKTADSWEWSLALLESMPEMLVVPDAASFQHVARICSEAGEWARAKALWDDMKQSGVSTAVTSRNLSQTFRACEKAQDWSFALVLLDELRKARSAPSALNFKTALLACDQRGRWEHCLRLWQEMRSQTIVPELAHFNSAMNSCMKGKLWEECISVLDLMEDQATSSHFEVAISTCKENQMWEVALRLLHRMLTVGPTPDRQCFTATITACAKGRADTSHWAYSLLLLERMMAPEIGATERVGCVPSANTFGEVMSALQRGRQWEHCLALFDQMQEIGLTPSYACTHSAMRACEFSARWEHALAVYGQHFAYISSDVPDRLDLGVDMLILTCLINACAKAGQLHHLHHEVFARLLRYAEQVLHASMDELQSGVVGGHRVLGLSQPSKAKEGMTAIGYAHMAFTRLCSLDMQPSAPLQRWRRAVQRTVEGALRDLQPLVRPWGPLPPPGVHVDTVRCMNDLSYQFTGDVLSRMGLRTLHFPNSSPPMAAMRRFTWWEIDRLPPDPEGWFVLAAIQYEVALGVGLGGLRCRSKIHYYNHLERCKVALSPVRMMQDRMTHRGWHAERQALLGLSFRMLSRYRALGDEEERKWPRGPVHLYVNHTPCLSCMAVIAQFQGRFPGLSFSVTFDVWQDLRAHQQDPWDAIWPRWPPQRPVPREPCDSPPPAEPPPAAAEPPPGPAAAERPEGAPAVDGAREEPPDSWQGELAAFRARYPMNDRVFQVLCASPKEVQESLVDTFSCTRSGDAEDHSKPIMQQIVQLRRHLSPAAAAAAT